MSNSEDLTIRRSPMVDLQQIVPLVLGMMLLTVGLSMFLSGTTDGMALVQPCIVVFGGTTVAMLATFRVSHIGNALQSAVDRGLRGGTSIDEMVRALMKVCDISRRDGLLGVAEVKTDSRLLNNVCELVGDAADDQFIRSERGEQREREISLHKSNHDVFLFTAIYAVMIGLIGTVLRAVSSYGQALSASPLGEAGLRSVESTALSALPALGLADNTFGLVMLPAICGISFALLLTILLGRMRNVHQKELVIVDLAYQGAAIILDDNNVQRLKNRLLCSLPQGTR